jgi:hypothetical protein
MHDVILPEDTNELPRQLTSRLSFDGFTSESSKSRKDWEVTMAHPAFGSFSISNLPIELSQVDVDELGLMVASKLFDLVGRSTEDEKSGT